ncbi:putative clathrin assembly protein At1g03050 [Argentina anserina]|uniref:putative clathrin assembly protein At1g03050 n=1 Tax=Argentina anserina TaxID=57926 RepID=UPI0021768472|nr:putative clathrin assembly protein At1g03050 [Potentilla anserina]
MSSSKFRRALGAVKDQTSIGLAKVGSSTSLADLDVAIVKATRHEEYPTEEKYIREILSLTCYSRAYISACVNTISRRLNKTKNWIVALKTLMLIQRLLSEGDPAYEQEIFFSTRRGTRFLNMSDFRDTAGSNTWDYSAFVRTYALYLDERLEFRMQSRRGKRSVFGIEDEEGPEQNSNNQQVCNRATPVHEMRHDKLFSRMQHLQQLLERFIATRPTGEAKNNRVIIVALYPLVKESFQIYYDVTEIMGTLIDRFMELEVPDGVKVYEVFVRIGKQFDELDVFYTWCKNVGIARTSEYPEVEKITPKKLEVMDEYIRDKSAMEQGRKVIRALEPRGESPVSVESKEEPDMNSIKALPSPEDVAEAPVEEEKEEEPIVEKDEPKKQDVGDLLNLGDDAGTNEEQGVRLALALFNGPEGSITSTTGPQPWEAFSEEDDWETALVQSATNLPNQKTSLGGGFDLLLLDGMYQQAQVTSTMAGPGYGTSGSASSVALGSAGRPAMLALPAPPTQSDQNADRSMVVGTTHVDPFAASMVVPPPSYVQMSDLEKKQKLLMEEQLMWHQYARDGMQGQIGLTKLQHNPHYHPNVGGYTHTY